MIKTRLKIMTEQLIFNLTQCIQGLLTRVDCCSPMWEEELNRPDTLWQCIWSWTLDSSPREGLGQAGLGRRWRKRPSQEENHPGDLEMFCLASGNSISRHIRQWCIKQWFPTGAIKTAVGGLASLRVENRGSRVCRLVGLPQRKGAVCASAVAASPGRLITVRGTRDGSVVRSFTIQP